jgi:hypothetical protein
MAVELTAPPFGDPQAAGTRRKVAWHPRLFPTRGLPRGVLLALLVFTLARGVLWDVTTPTLWGPDEDYHAMYADTISRDGRIIDPAIPLYSLEYSRTADRTSFNTYGAGPRTDFSGDPKASIKALQLLPEAAREGTAVGRGVGVVHPPLFHAVAAIPDRLAGDAAFPTRMFWMRFMSACWGILAVYGAWLLAAQVFTRQGPALLVGSLVATQPMLGYLSGLVNHDIALTALFALACAQMAFIMRIRAAWQQGLVLGVLIGLAMLVKASAAVLVVLGGLTFAFQGAAYRDWRAVARSVCACGGAVLLLAGWWYAHSRIAYGSFTGAIVADVTGPQTPAATPTRGYFDASAGEYARWTREWLSDWYKTTFFHFFNYEAPGGRWYYFAPGFALIVGLCATGGLLLTKRRQWRAQDPLTRQILVLLLALPLLLVPFLVTDFSRKLAGEGFFVNAGRYILPAYAPLITCVVAGLLWSVRRAVQPLLAWAIGICGGALCFYVWHTHYAYRYFGRSALDDIFARMAFDRPEFVTQASIWILVGVICASAVVLVVGGARISNRPLEADTD